MGCSTTKHPTALSYVDLQNIRVTSADCPRIDQKINFVEEQLKRRGLYGQDPTTFTEEERLYNVRAHGIIWGLRIGCSNPNRYKQ